MAVYLKSQLSTLLRVITSFVELQLDTDDNGYADFSCSQISHFNHSPN